MNRLSARNQIQGRFVDVSKGATTSHVRLELGAGIIIMASIINEAVAELKAGIEARALRKASELMIRV